MQLFRNVLLICVSLLLPYAHLIAEESRGEFRSMNSTASALTGDLDDKLIKAIIKGDAKAVKTLIAAGANIEATNLYGSTALIEAAGTKDFHEDTAINAVRALIDLGANVNATDLFGGTALMEAAKHNNVNTVIALISAGADVKITDKSGNTAFDLADQYGALSAAEILYTLKRG